MVPADGKPPKEAQEWKRVSDPEEVETTLLNRNGDHFGQGDGTPFTKDTSQKTTSEIYPSTEQDHLQIRFSQVQQQVKTR
jgi:hypothetical protein